MKLLVATNNKGKIVELLRLLDLTGLELLTAVEAGLPSDFDVEETGVTFEENAVLKATQYAQATGLVALADDSGLEVDALGGEPGVYSKRWAGEGLSDAERNTALLQKIAQTNPTDRTAQFVAVVALARPDGTIIETQTGVCRGSIAYEPHGMRGFGYDPIFIVEGEQGQTLGELDGNAKDRVSHRGKAVRKIRPTIIFLLNS